MNESLLQAAALTLAYDDREVVHDLDLVVPRGQITAVVGANGCGKSTLLRALARLMRPRAGSVLLDGRVDRRAVHEGTSPSGSAILPQSPLAPDGLAVEDLVARGRYPHQTLFQPLVGSRTRPPSRRRSTRRR